ncbi:hypothetical protein [Paenibacillus sp. A3]|uniref:hypothetical protein n=1 Tax=Paenibacillus sp. A3 TaxID=1337054 RepID=UPI000A6B020D|nr:hypothetical protein [Paenibacillus sp. A3]
MCKVDLGIWHGELFPLLGPNGTDKTTTPYTDDDAAGWGTVCISGCDVESFGPADAVCRSLNGELANMAPS